jgi:hypothetical protein
MVSLSSLDLCTARAEDANTALLRLALLLLVVAQQLDADAVGLAGRGIEDRDVRTGGSTASCRSRRR